MNWIESPEFWIACAFLLVILLAILPLGRMIKNFGERQATLIQHRFDEATALADKAQHLKEQYYADYQNRQSLRSQLMADADHDIAFLEAEALAQCRDRMARQQQETKLRLQMIEENGRQDIKRQMLNQIISKAQKSWPLKQDKRKTAQSTNLWVEKVCVSLDLYKSSVK